MNLVFYVSLVGVVVGGAGLVYAVWNRSRLERDHERLEALIEELQGEGCERDRLESAERLREINIKVMNRYRLMEKVLVVLIIFNGLMLWRSWT